MNHFDQASRFAAKLDPPAFLRWLFKAPVERYRFLRWLDARRLPFPGNPDRACDTVAEIDDTAEPSPPWAVAVEFQTEPDPDMFARFLIYLGEIRLELRPDKERGSRYQVGGVVVNLTGTAESSRDMTLGDTGLRTNLQLIECNMATEYAQTVLDGIAAGAVGRCLLPWIPLMRGGDEAGIIERWKEVAATEPDERRRGEYGGLALVFAEAADRAAVWKGALKEWNMKVSKQVLEWQAEGQATMLLEVLASRFPGDLPSELINTIREMHDPTTLTRWGRAAATAQSLDDFRRTLSNGGT
jgi:hypothetical protein